MLFLFLSTLIIFGLSKYFYKTWVHPIVLFSGTWLVIFFLYLLQLFDITPLTMQMNIILFLMIFSFVTGALAYQFLEKFLKSSKKNSQKNDDCVSYSLRSKLFLILCFVTIIVMFKDELSIIQSLLGGANFEDIQKMAGGKNTVNYSGPLQISFYMLVVFPITAIVSPVCAVEFFSRKDNKKFIFFIVNIMIVMLNVASRGGRNTVLVMLVSYMCVYTLFGKKTKISRTTRNNMIIMFCCCSVLIVSLSVSRGISDVFLSFYAYMITAIPLGQVFLNDLFVSSHLSYGFFSVKGFFQPIYMLLNYFGIHAPEGYENAVSVREFMEASYYSIGDYSVTGMNSFMPAGAIAYVDGRYVGEIIIMFLYGMFSMWIYYRQQSNHRAVWNGGIICNKKDTAAYAMCAYGLFLSFAMLWFERSGYAVGFLYIMLLFYSKRHKETTE